MIVGTNRVELEFPGGRPHRDAFLAKAFGENSARARSYYRVDRPDPVPDPRLATDVTFRCPALRLAQMMAAKGASVWLYEFDASPPDWKTSHAAEIPYAFGSSKFAELSLAPYWLNFIMTRDPNGPALPSWPTFHASQQRHLLFSDEGVAEVGADRTEICSLLDRL